MKRFLTALAASVGLLLTAGTGAAVAGDLIAPAPTTPLQQNESDQRQVQVVPIAPQANVQNANVATYGDVEQGNANNANTGQAAQQENTLGSQASPVHRNVVDGGQGQTGAQENESDQRQVQVVPVAPQLNVQNVNVGTGGDVEQGDANNANTGQAAQQENTRVSGERGKHETPCCPREHGEKRCPPKGEASPCPPKQEPKPSHPRHERKACPPRHEPKPSSLDRSTAQRNESSQRQVQIVPIAPQVNVQNLNVLTFGDVEQGNANNANTGQATQQSNTLLAGRGKGGSPPLV